MKANHVLCVACLITWFNASNMQAQQVPAACGDGKCIQVASYNIELFGNERRPYNNVPRGQRSDAEIERIADRISIQLDLEIVVFEEINTESDEWIKLKDKLAAKGYKFFEGTSSDRKQFVVLAWDADEVSLLESAKELNVRNSFNLPGNCTGSGLRKPVAGKFKSGEFDFWVVGVHLKSRSGEETCTSMIRSEQSKDLVAAITELTSGGERDVLIVGDFNEKAGHGSFQPLTDAGFTSQMRFLMPESAKGSYVKNDELHESTDLIDQVLIRFEETQEVVRNSAFAMKLASEEETRKYIIGQSDHVPVWVSFRTDVDRD